MELTLTVAGRRVLEGESNGAYEDGYYYSLASHASINGP